MAPSLLRHPGHLSPASALQLSQKATEVLRKSAGAVSSSPLGALLSGSETPELWIHHENLLLACLRTGDEPTARQCLERLVARFGADNERVMALGGLVKEAAAPDDSALEAVMRDYDEILAENNTNIVRSDR